MKKRQGLKSISSLLLKELNRRFQRFLEPDDLQHDPVFLMATILDPRYQMLLDSNQKTSAKTELLRQVYMSST